MGVHEPHELVDPTLEVLARVRLAPGGSWRHALLAIREDQAVILVRGVVRGPRNVDCVRVYSGCPIELLDAAVERGYYVEGQPREAAK
jgi:hypothetical protein